MASKKSTAAEAAVYALEELTENAKALFGAEPETVKGALYGVDARTPLSTQDVQDLIDQFLNRKVN